MTPQYSSPHPPEEGRMFWMINCESLNSQLNVMRNGLRKPGQDRQDRIGGRVDADSMLKQRV